MKTYRFIQSCMIDGRKIEEPAFCICDISESSARQIVDLARMAGNYDDMEILQRDTDSIWIRSHIDDNLSDSALEAKLTWTENDVISFPADRKKIFISKIGFGFCGRFGADDNEDTPSHVLEIKNLAAYFDLEWEYTNYSDFLQAKFHKSNEDPVAPQFEFSEISC